MGRSVVYFTDMRATPERNLLQKFRALIERAGIEDINFEKQFTAIKIHLGEPGNIAYLRPNFAKVVADKVKELGGKPFLTDSNTLYVGRRKDALEHLEAAYENGYNPFCTGCHVVIADGLKGTDEALVPRQWRRVYKGSEDRPRDSRRRRDNLADALQGPRDNGLRRRD